MLNKTNEEYIKTYFRIHQEIYNALVSLYYLKAIKEINPLDRKTSFKNEFIIFISKKLQETICSQIYKLLLDGTQNNRKSIEYFVDFINKHYQLNKVFNISFFMNEDIKSSIIKHRHNYINHIQFDDNLQDIKIFDLENVLMKITEYFNDLYIEKYIPLNNQFNEQYLHSLKEKCRIAILDSIK